jgi:hypothetical protein
MGAIDGSVVGLTKIVSQGTAAGKWNLVIVAEGYRARQLPAFDTHARAFATTLLATPPFTMLAPAINVFRLDVSSTDAGADDPAACGGTGASAATFFDASFCNSGLRRFLVPDTTAVQEAVAAALPEYDAVVVIVNSPIFGGSGVGQVATFSLAPGAHDIGLHELGHSAFGLADEYAEGLGRHPVVEPAAANITVKRTRAALKWKALVVAGTPIPTGLNPACSRGNAPPGGGGGIGTYEGARRFDCKVFRPAPTCKMRELTAPFCDVCQARIRVVLQPFMGTT